MRKTRPAVAFLLMSVLAVMISGAEGLEPGAAATKSPVLPVAPAFTALPAVPTYVPPSHHVDGFDPVLADISNLAASGADWKLEAAGHGATVLEDRVLVQVDANLRRNVYEGSTLLREPTRYSPADHATLEAAFPDVTLVDMGSDTRFRAWVPAASLRSFRDAVVALQPESVVFASHPEHAAYGSVNNEGVGAMGVPGYPAPAPSGSGIKVAIIDNGFAGVNTTAAAEVGLYTSPQANVHTGSEAHGTACAEIIRDVAPSAELRLYALPLGMSYMQAAQDAITWGADVISVSLGGHGYPGEGDGPDAARLAYQNGIIWCNSAGNYGYRDYWEKQAPVVDSSTYVEQSPGVTLNQLNTTGASRIWVSFTNEQPTGAYAQFQIQLFADSGSGPTLIAQGTAGSTLQSVIYNGVQASTTYYVGIRRSQTGTIGKMRFFLFDGGSLTQYSNVGSITNPACLSTEVTTVGAVNYSSYNASGSPTYYSSRGGGIWNMPLDFCAPTACSTVTYGSGGFHGTSCSCPNAAGLVALQLSHAAFQSNPLGTLTLVNLGAAGWDVDSGWGIVKAPTTTGGSGVTLYQNQPVSLATTPSNITITPQQFFWNAVAITSPASANWDLQMSTVASTAAAGVNDFLVANGNLGTIINAGLATRTSGSMDASIEHAGLTPMVPGTSTQFDFSGGHAVHLWEIDVAAAGTYPVTVSGTASTNFRWYVYSPGTNSLWKGAAGKTHGPFNPSSTAQNLSMGSTGRYALVVVLDNGATSTDTITVDIGNPVQVPTIFVSQSSLNMGTTSQGVPGAIKSYTVGGTYLTGDIVIQSPLTVELSTSGATGTWTPQLILTQSGGTVLQTTIYARIAASAPTGAISGNIDHTSPAATTYSLGVTGTMNPPATPTINMSVATLNLGATTQGSAGQAYSYTVGGTGLTGNVNVAPPADIEVSLAPTSGFGSSLNLSPTGGVLGTTTIYARIGASYAAGNVTGTIDHASAGAISRAVGLSGVVVMPGSGAIIVSHASINLETTKPVSWNNGTEFHYDVQGTGLVSNVVITAPPHVEIRTAASTIHASSKTLVPSGGLLPLTRIYVRMQVGSGYVGPVSGNITHVSTGATTEVVSVSGTSVSSSASAIMLYNASAGFSPIPMGTQAYGVNSSTASFIMYYNNIAGGLHIQFPPGIQGKTTNGPWVSEIFFSGATSGNRSYGIRIAPDTLPGIVAGEIIVTATGSPRGRILVEGLVTAPGGPAIGLSVDAQELADADHLSPSVPASYSVSATNLTGNLTITAPTDVELSLSAGIGTFTSSVVMAPINGEIQSTVVYVRIASSAACTSSADRNVAGNVTHIAAGAASRNLPASGTLKAGGGRGMSLSVATLNLGTSEAGQPGTQHTYTVSITPQTPTDHIHLVCTPEIEIGHGASPSSYLSAITISGSTTPVTVSVRIRAGTPEGIINASVKHHQFYVEDRLLAVSGEVVAATTPTIVLEPPVYAHTLSAAQGNPSTSTVWGVRGYSLTTDIVVTAPTGVEVSLDDQTFSPSVALVPSAGSVPLSSVYARFQATAPAGPINGNVSLASAGATSQTVAINGRVYATGLPTPFCDTTHVLLPATEANAYGTGVPISVSGVNCTSRIAVVRQAAAIELSLDNLNWSGTVQTALPTAGVIAPTVVYVRRTSSGGNHGHHSAGYFTIEHSGTINLNIQVSCFGTLPSASTYTLVSPNGNETWQAGTTQTITWTHDAGYPRAVALELSADGGATWIHVIAASKAATAGSVDWAIPSTAPTATTYRIRVRARLTAMADASDASFTISAAAVGAVQSTQASLNLGTTTVGLAGSAVGYDVSGSNLGTIPITITPPAGVEIRNATASGTFSSNAILLLPTAGSVPTTTIEVRMAASATVGQSFNDLLQVSGVATQHILLFGTVDPPPPGISVSPGSLNLGSVTQGGTGSAQAWLITGSNLTQDITVTPPAGVEIRDTTLGGFTSSPINIVPTAGSVSVTFEARIASTATAGQTFGDITHASGAATNLVTLTGSVLAQPSVNAMPAALNLGTTVTGTTGSTVDSYALSAANLVQNLVVSAPAGIQIRDAAGGPFAATPLTFVPSAGAVNVTIEARIAPTATAGMSFGVISNVSGAASQNVTITGTVLSPPQLGVTPTDVDLGSTTAGTTGSTVDSYAISGSNLLANVVVTPPAGTEIRNAAGGSFSSSALTFVPSAGSVSVTIEARIAASATAGQSFGSITNVSGSENASVNVTAFAFGSAQLVSAPTSLNLGATMAGAAGTTVDTFALSGSNLQANVTVTPPTGVEIRDAAGGTFGASPLNFVPVAGDINVSIEARISASATAGQVFADITCTYQALSADVSVTGTVLAGPMISLMPGALNLGATKEGTAGAGFTYSVSGSDLAADVIVTPPAGIEVRLLPSGAFGTAPLVLTQTGGTLAATDIEVRIAAAATAGQSLGTISHVSGTTSTDMTLSGTVNSPGGGGGGGGGEDGACTSGNQSGSTALLLLTLLSLAIARRRRRTR